MKRQPNLTLQTLITYLLQEDTLNKSINATSDCMLALYIGKRPCVPQYKIQKFQQKSSRGMETPISSSKFHNNNNFQPDMKNNLIWCIKCKKLGHSIKECRVRIAEDKAIAPQSNVVLKNPKLYVAALQEGSNDAWYLDTGATNHMSYDITSFVTYNKWDTWQVIYLL